MSEPSPIDLGAADEWRVLLLLHGAPIGYLILPSPGRTQGNKLADLALRRRARSHIVYQNFIERFRQRMGAPDALPERPTCSMIVCTHRRPAYLTDLLNAMSVMDPSPDEVIVVDNDPGSRDCELQVEAFGATYVREERRGLDHARNAGLARAACDLVAFTDDDCIPPSGWLAGLAELFGDPLVGAVTGPAFAYELDSASQVRFEDSGGFRRGMERRVWDWTSLPPHAAGRAGAGANMIFRRTLLRELGEVFPVELDAGTLTQSGGDMYALYKVLRSGHRVVYDPATYVFHQHRTDPESLRRTLWGYGVGLSAALTKLMFEERELGAASSWLWLWRQYMKAVASRVLNGPGASDVQSAWEYFRGGLMGPLLWRRALAQADIRPALRHPPARKTAPFPDPGALEQTSFFAGSRPGVSIVIPTAGRPAALCRCLQALACQSAGSPSFEVVVVDDARPDQAPARVPDQMNARLLTTGGIGAGGARNAGAGDARGRVLLFLDDDLVASPDLVRVHFRHHANADDRVVVGYSPPRPPLATLPSLAASLWWEDHFRTKRDSPLLTFPHILSGNTSITSAAFQRVGGFDEALGRFRREDWEWGIRALGEGLEAVYEPEALAHHEFELQTRHLIDAARREGSGDAILVGRFPFAYESLPLARLETSHGGLSRRLAIKALSHPWALASVVRLLQVLEWANLRGLWFRTLKAARWGAYQRGLRAGGLRGPQERAGSAGLVVELDSRDPITAPKVAAPQVELRLHGLAAGRFYPAGGSWDGSIAAQAAGALDRRLWSRLDAIEFPSDLETPDLRELAVVLGPARLEFDELHARSLEEAGAEVILVDGAEFDHWGELDAAVRACSREIVALPLPGARLESSGLAYALHGLEGNRIGAVAVCGLSAEHGARATPISLASRATHPTPFAISTRGAHCWLLRRDTFESVGGFQDGAAGFEPYGVVADLLERLLESGFVLASCAVPKFEGATGTPAAEAVRVRRSLQIRGALTAQRSTEMGIGSGSLFFARNAIFPVIKALSSLRRSQGRRESLREAVHMGIGSLSGFRRAVQQTLGTDAHEALPLRRQATLS